LRKAQKLANRSLKGIPPVAAYLMRKNSSIGNILRDGAPANREKKRKAFGSYAKRKWLESFFADSLKAQPAFNGLRALYL